MKPLARAASTSRWAPAINASPATTTVHPALKRASSGNVVGVVVQYGGQTPLNLAQGLRDAGVPILGTSPESIHLAENRERLNQVLQELGLRQPPSGIAFSQLEAASITDFGLWGGLVPGSVPDMAEMAGRVVVGFKAFMCDSGLPEFPRADDATLYDGLREAARLGLPVAVHAENEELTRALSQRMTGRSARDFLGSRPVVAELEAIQRVLLFAGETQAALHIVHISTEPQMSVIEALAKSVAKKPPSDWW